MPSYANPLADTVAGLALAGHDAKQWARRAHKPPELISKLKQLRAALQEHRAEFDHAIELMTDGLADGASEAQRADALTITALLADIAEETELVVNQHTAAAEDPDIPLRANFRAQKRRAKLRLANFTESAAELFNELGDVYFLTILWAKAWALFCVSVTLLTANMLGRLWVICAEMKHVEKGKRWAFCRGAAIFLLEPNSGMRMMKKALKEKERGGLVHDPKTGSYVTKNKDAVAVAAQNDLVAGRAEIRTIALMSGTEDVPELLVQLIFLLMQGESVGIGFWVAAIGTLIHLSQRGIEGWVTQSNLSMLKLLAYGRDKTFETDATDADLMTFVRDFGAETRILSLRQCPAITDDGAMELAAGCPHLTSLHLGYTHLTDRSVSQIGMSCSHLTTLYLSGVTQVTDDSVAKVARGLPHLKTLSLNHTQVTDVGMAHVADGLPGLTMLYLMDTNVTDQSLANVARGLPNLTMLMLAACSRVTDQGVADVAAGCPQLTQLFLQETAVTDDGLERVVDGCSHLTVLDLSLTEVTDRSLFRMATGLLDLTKLYLTGTQASEGALSQFVEQRPTVKVDTSRTGTGLLIRSKTRTKLGGGSVINLAEEISKNTAQLMDVPKGKG